ncbi:transmembrane channel-like protein 7 isoform X2 [Amphibalanus amphitrite]|uniref:transmembrane channel-like protein 7 isoform X2 n=1 Tax=Amphibalanus amphitrite TaxID=1232801 RepID=UPI001C91C357|nr:transmembrane channel-like protein 7 isoform X2 [Amphibalanus amphitrite]
MVNTTGNSEPTTPQAAANVDRRRITREVGRTARPSGGPCPSVRCDNLETDNDRAETPPPLRGSGVQLARDGVPAADSSQMRLPSRSRPSIENCGFARAMMKQMPSKMALSASGIANLGYGRSAPDVTMTGAGLGTSSTSFFRATPSLIRYEKDVARLAEIIEAEVRAQKNSMFIEDRKITRLRELPVSLTVKRKVRQRLETNLMERKALVKQTRLMRWSADAGRALVLTKRYMAEAHGLVHIWHEQMKTIEGNFGQNVGLYFRFMRWLLIVNMEVLLISFLFLVVPQLVMTIYDPEAARRSALGLPDPIHARMEMENRTIPNLHFFLSNLLTGQGWLYSTPMYYGYYYRDSIRTSSYTHYHMPSAYLAITTFCITYQLMKLATSTARSYRKNFIDVSTDTSGNVANLIFAGWDARVTSQELAELKRTGLYQAFQRKLKKKEELHAAEQAAAAGEDPAAAAQRRRAQLYTVLGRLASNLLVVAVLGAVAVLTWNVMGMDATLGPDGSFISLLGSAIMISASMALFPMLFQFLGMLENFKHPRALMFITLIRMVVMAIIILGTIVIYWVQQVNNRSTDTDSGARDECWENEVGSELYQLMIVDLFFMFVFELGLEFARKVAHEHGLWVEEPHFDIPRNTMFLIYSQTLVWTGAYFSPLLSLVGSAKLAIMFYVRKWSMFRHCTPQSRSVRASQTQTLFRMVAFIVCFLAACFTGYIVTNVRPSATCGPFQQKSLPSVVVNDTFTRWKDEGHTAPYTMAMYSSRPGVVAVWLLIFSVVAYYLRSLALARQEMIVLLRGQLVLEGQDKVMLLQLIDEAATRLQGMRRINRPGLPDVEEEDDDQQVLPVDDPRAIIKVLFEPAKDDEPEPEAQPPPPPPPPPSPHSLSAAAELAEARLAVEQAGKSPPRLSVVRRTPFPLGTTGTGGPSSQIRRPSKVTKADEKRQAATSAAKYWSRHAQDDEKPPQK